MPESIIDISRNFFYEIVRPNLERECPAEMARTAFGVFGYGSEALKLDDEYSRDHHWGLRINALMPDDLFQTRRDALQAAFRANLPASYQGHALREGHAGTGLELDSYESFLARTIGLKHAPQTLTEWLMIPEEDITHLTNGEVWYDPAGDLTRLRATFNAYYPEPVRLRRIANACRFYSGMGTYALKRALLRDNPLYATIAFARSIRLGIHIAFMLDRTYYPYDKWLYAYLLRLPRMSARLRALVDEAVALETAWTRKLELLDRMSDILDETMVEDGVIAPHPKYVGSASSGYRLLEHAYIEIIKKVPDEIKQVVPVTEQIYLEQFHSGFVNAIDIETWHTALNLKPAPDA